MHVYICIHMVLSVSFPLAGGNNIYIYIHIYINKQRMQAPCKIYLRRNTRLCGNYTRLFFFHFHASLVSDRTHRCVCAYLLSDFNINRKKREQKVQLKRTDPFAHAHTRARPFSPPDKERERKGKEEGRGGSVLVVAAGGRSRAARSKQAAAILRREAQCLFCRWKLRVDRNVV